MITPKKTVSWIPIFSIVGFGLLLAIPLLLNSCLAGHDFEYHVVISKHFAAQFWQGEFYPRWLQKTNANFGSPTFFFYAPIPYYFTSLFSPLSHYYNLSSCHELALSSLLALIASGLTAYAWLKEIVPKTSAAIASIVYMAWPYHLAIDLYVRFAFAEYWAFVWMPLILYFSIKMTKGSQLNIIGLAISLALLALTHLPTFIIFFPVPIGYALFMARQNQWKMIAARMSLAVILAIGLSAIYWLPAMTTQTSISMNAMFTEGLNYKNNFLFTGPKFGHAKNFWRHLESLTLLTGGLAICAWKISEKYSKANSKVASRHERDYWIMVAMISLFMTLPLSKFVWDVLPAIRTVQFPWRFNTVLAVATIGLFALAISELNLSQLNLNDIFSNRLNKTLLFRMSYVTTIVLILIAVQIFPLQKKITFWGSRSTLLSLCIIAFLLLGISFIRKPINFSSHKLLSAGFLLTLTILLGSQIYSAKYIFFTRTSNDVPRLTVSMGAYEHRPRWVPEKIFNPEGLTQLSAAFNRVRIDSGKTSLLIRQWHPRKIVLQLQAATNAELTIHQFYYPGWSAKIKGLSQRLPIHPSKFGILQISVPAGEHEISVTLDAVIEELIGQMISAVSAVITLMLVFILSRDGRPIQHRQYVHRLNQQN
jgi:hypothetical protein